MPRAESVSAYCCARRYDERLQGVVLAVGEPKILSREVRHAAVARRLSPQGTPPSADGWRRARADAQRWHAIAPSHSARSPVL